MEILLHTKDFQNMSIVISFAQPGHNYSLNGISTNICIEKSSTGLTQEKKDTWYMKLWF